MDITNMSLLTVPVCQTGFTLTGNNWGPLHIGERNSFSYSKYIVDFWMFCMCWLWKYISLSCGALKCLFFFGFLTELFKILGKLQFTPLNVAGIMPGLIYSGKLCNLTDERFMTIPSCLYHSAFTFSFCVFPGSNSSDWLRSVHGGDDFWSCWYSLVFQWLGGTWQMCLKGRTPRYHVTITPHSVRALCFRTSYILYIYIYTLLYSYI